MTATRAPTASFGCDEQMSGSGEAAASPRRPQMGHARHHYSEVSPLGIAFEGLVDDTMSRRRRMEVAMRSGLLLGLCIAGSVSATDAIALPALNKNDARQKALAVARHRISHSDYRYRSDAAVKLDHADRTSFFFDAHATRPCRPGQAVCSSLLGHFRVDRDSGAVFDEDVEPERRIPDTAAQ